MRILAFAIPEFACMFVDALMTANKNLVAIVLPPAAHPACKPTKMLAKSFNIPVIKVGKHLNDPEVVDQIKSYKPDVILIASYPKLIPPEIYNIPPLGTINCHPSILPQYRGSNPYFHVIRNGEKETGITYHYVDDSYDTGDIIAQWRVPLLPDETLGTLYFRLSYKASELYLQIIDTLERTGKLAAIPQPKLAEVLNLAPEVKDGSIYTYINWNEDVASIERHVRSLNPFFSATTHFRNMRLRIWSGQIVNSSIFRPSGEPGTIVKVSNNEMLISASNGLYSPACVQYGMFYMCDIKEFITRNDPKVGEILN